jgi:hypothetical protein
MTDPLTKKPIRVSADGSAGPYIIVQLSQVPAIREVLDRNSIPYWVDETAISIDGRPAVTFVNLGARVEAQLVQNVLDNAA